MSELTTTPTPLNLALRIAIVKRHQSQRQVARLADIPEARFSNIINGWATPRPAEKFAIARVLNLDPAELFL